MKAVLILVTYEKRKITDDMVVKAIDKSLMEKILSYDEQQIAAWQIGAVKELNLGSAA